MSGTLVVTRRGQGPTLLLLHGIGSSRTAWDGQIANFEDAFTCIAPDLPGYGDSPDAAATGLAPIVAAVAGVLDGTPAHVVGVSFGGLVALAMAHRHRTLVSSLVLADATLGRAKDPDDARQQWLAKRSTLAANLSKRSLERAAEIAAPGASDAVLAAIAAPMRRARPSGYLAVAHAITETDAEPWLAAIAHPALVVCGEHDRVTGPRVSQTLARNLPHARLATMPGVGHAPHIERPDRFATLVREFLMAVR